MTIIKWTEKPTYLLFNLDYILHSTDAFPWRNKLLINVIWDFCWQQALDPKTYAVNNNWVASSILEKPLTNIFVVTVIPYTTRSSYTICIVAFGSWESAKNRWYNYPDSNVHGANKGPTWLLSAPDGPILAPWTLLSGYTKQKTGKPFAHSMGNTCFVFNRTIISCNHRKAEWLIGPPKCQYLQVKLQHDDLGSVCINVITWTILDFWI